jgi:hypothetical protein
MIVSNFDTELDNVLNDFYEQNIEKGKLKEIIDAQNIMDKENDINSILKAYFISLNFDFIKKIVTDDLSIKLLCDTVKKYVAYYMFTFSGYFCKGKMDVFRNNIVEISKLHNNQKVDIPGFFTGDSNANIFTLVDMSRIMRDIIEEQLQNNKSNKLLYDETQKIMDDVGEVFVKSFLKISSKQKNIFLQAHNIIKTILFRKLYQSIDRKEILKILEDSITTSTESIYITIVIPTEKSVDLDEIESMLTPHEIEQGIAKNIYDTLVKSATVFYRKGKSNDAKIIDMINSGLIIPISEDFMLYHKEDEKYDKNVNDKTKKENIKIKYILEKINSVENYYSSSTDKKEIDNLIHNPLANRLAITYNEYEDVKIINKILSSGIKGIENNDSFNELIYHRKYPYVNFKELSKDGFSLLFDKTKKVIRHTTFSKDGQTKQMLRNPVQLRIGSSEQQLNIVGFLFNPSKNALECLRVNDVQNVANDYDSFYSQISNFILTGTGNIISWLFDLENDKKKITTYEHYDSTKMHEQCKV